MQRLLVVLVLAGIVLGSAAPARADQDAGMEFGWAVGAAATNLVYTPAKFLMASAGMLVGGITGVLTGGDVRSAYAIWVPTVSGTYFLTAANLEGTEPVEFIGTDYADRPSPRSSVVETGALYEAQYSM